MPFSQPNRFKRPSHYLWPSHSQIDFQEGLYGFEQWQEYVLKGRGEETPFLWLETQKNKKISFVVVDPFLICPHYEPVITKFDLECVGVEDKAELFLLSIVNTQADPYTLNLGFPLLIHGQKRRGKQILAGGDCAYPITTNLVENSINQRYQ
jgi:flagellar assembly factor FliW